MSPKAELDVVVRAGAEDIEKLESLRSTIEPLANTASLVMGTDVEKPAASIAVVDSGVEVFVVLEGKVDLSAEKATPGEGDCRGPEGARRLREDTGQRGLCQGRARGGPEEEGPCS